MSMRIFLTTVIILSSTSVAVYQIVKNLRYKSLVDEKARFSPMVILAACLALCADIFVGGAGFSSLIADLMPAIVCMIVITSSLFEKIPVRPVVIAASSSDLAMVLLHLSSFIIEADPIPSSAYLSFTNLMILVMIIFFLYAVVVRLKDVKVIMKTGTVWSNVSLVTDAVYLVLVLIFSLLHDDIPSLSFFMTGGILVALGIRVAGDSIFVIWRRQERRIVESLKITKVESVTDATAIDDVYRDIYERVVLYFEQEKPFLDNDLTINDLVKVIYSNKLYISRAISQFTGRNFCQFVNYYRITYAMECFRSNPELRNHEMATMSGFNSIVSYNMAFRLFMGENPSDWCRKEKHRLIKHIK